LNPALSFLFWRKLKLKDQLFLAREREKTQENKAGKKQARNSNRLQPALRLLCESALGCRIQPFSPIASSPGDRGNV